MKTVLESLQAGTGWLERRGVPEPRLNMEHLLAHVLGMRRLDLYLQFDRPLGEEELAPLRGLLRRRGDREPLQHLLGEVTFAGHVFRCDARALVPRPETEELFGLVVAEPPGPGARVVDVGCGAGVLGLSLAAAWNPEQAGEVTLVDVSEDALALARENAVRLGLEEGVTLACSDLLAEVAGPLSVVVANLPYIPSGEMGTLQEEVRRDPALALDGGADGLDLVRGLAEQAAGKLAAGGCLALELGIGQAAVVRGLLEVGGAWAEVVVSPDDSGIDRFVIARKS